MHPRLAPVAAAVVVEALILGGRVASAAEWLAGVNPANASLAVVAEGEPILEIDYYDWGEGWSGVRRSTRVEEKGRAEAAFVMENVLERGNAPFRIEGSWKQTAPDTIEFSGRLTPERSAPLVMAQFALTPGRSLRPAGAEVTRASGAVQQVPVPFPIGSLGDDVRSMTFKDREGRPIVLRFDPPAKIPTHDAARIALVTDRMEAGKTYPLNFTLKLPQPVQFFPGPASVPSCTEGWYEFTGKSPIPAESEWALTSWLEAPAGKHGRIRAEGDQLIYNRKPIQLWGLNVSFAHCAPERNLAERRADFYAALGINSVRLHKYAEGPGWAGIMSPESNVEYDPEKLDRMDYFVAALKQRGIYTKLSPVFMMKLGPGDRERIPYMEELGEMRGNRLDPRHGSIYVSEELQDLLIEQVVKLLKHTNPHTGLTYAEDPAIAFLEIFNEDSALFGGINGVLSRSPTLRKRTGERFADWLKAKYGTEEAFLEAWGPDALNHDALANQRVPQDESWAERRIYPVGNPWFFDPDNLNTSQKPIERRLLDTMRFLYELQNEFYAKAAKAYRQAGYQGELIASNWVAGRAMSHLYNLHSDYLIGTIDRHNYFGESRRFAFNNQSMLANPGGGMFSASLNQVDGRPFMLSEWIHVERNENGVEGPAIIGAYGMGLQGWDVSYPFQNSDEGTWSRGIFREAWDVTAPNFMGIFPAVSRQVLRGDVKPAVSTHFRNVHIPSLDEQKVGFDDKVTQAWDVKTFDTEVFPSAALAASRGLVRFTDEFQPTEAFDLSPHLQDGAVHADTGQLVWRPGENSRDGHFTIDTPGTQAVVGFAKGQTADLTDLTITPQSDYGAIYFSAQAPDGTLRTDRGVVVAAIARARNRDAVIAGDALMFSKGAGEGGRPDGPVVMEPVKARVQLKRSGTPTVHILDHNGVRTGRTVPVQNGAFELDTGRDQTPYYLITW